MRRRAVDAMSLVVLALVAGCATDATTLDRTDTEQAVQRAIGATITVPVDKIRCPATIERGLGQRFVCRAVLRGDVGVVRLRVTQGDDDALEVVPLEAVLDRRAVSEDLRRTLVGSYRRTFAVTCAEPDIRVAEPGATFTCRATDDEGPRQIEVTVVDATGSVSYDVGT